MKELILYLNFVFVFTLISADYQLIVTTKNGQLKGKWMTSREGRVFAAFTGIPFAAPPTGPLRFKPPSPPKNWLGIKDATLEASVCIQRDLGGNEDCLYLNVYTQSTSVNRSSAVMVYIHGGGFYRGSSSLHLYGPEYLMDRDIVLVVLQYRLGVFGFLSTEDTVIPGNMGLKDQVRALQWVQENIRSFGGDPKKVTIFGNSAGSASVHLHMLSPLSKELFSKAISQSGTALSAFAFIGKGTSRSITHTLARNLNCSTDFSLNILQCLQSRNPELIQQEYSDLQDATGYEMRKVLFRPIVEEQTESAFFTTSPLKSTTNKPWLVGLNMNEGLFKIKQSSLNKTFSLIHSEFSKFGPIVMFFEDTCSKPAEIAKKIYNFYFNSTFTQEEMTKSLEQLISDSWFNWPTLQSIQKHMGTLFCYLFGHQGEYSYTDVLGGPKGFGVSHMDELRYLFTQKHMFPSVMNEKDISISKLIVNMWVNFAEETNPTPEPININPQHQGNKSIIWEQSTNINSPKFLLINSEKLTLINNIFKTRMLFWENIKIRDILAIQ